MDQTLICLNSRNIFCTKNDLLFCWLDSSEENYFSPLKLMSLSKIATFFPSVSEKSMNEFEVPTLDKCPYTY